MKTFGIALLILIISVSAIAQIEPSVTMNISRIDARSHRVFVAPSTEILTSMKSTKEYISRLSVEIGRQYPEWSSQWIVSFFSDPRYATYKDEQVQVAVEDGTWVKAYLAEYDNTTKIIVMAPLDPAKMKKVKLE